VDNFKKAINFNDIRKRIETDKNQYAAKGKDWAGYVGVLPTVVSNFHRGKNPRNPSFEYILAVAYKTGKPVEWYLYGETPSGSDIIKEPAANYGSPEECSPENLHYFQMLKTILESDDEVTKAAIKANLVAFEQSITRAGELKEKLESIKSLSSRLSNVEKALNESGPGAGNCGEKVGNTG